MKKIVSLVLLTAILLLLVSCGAEKNRSYDEAEVKAAAENLIMKTERLNKIFWGDNLQVMSHMLKEYRGKINLVYIDPPFDSKADYKKKIEVKGVGKAENDATCRTL